MKKERPILMSTPMVRATLEMRKTITRRMTGLESINENPDNWQKVTPDVYPGAAEEGDLFSYCDFQTLTGEYMACPKCPYGQVGDLLWVRETFISGSEMVDEVFVYDEHGQKVDKAWYKADGGLDRWFDGDLTRDTVPWKPSIHMPKSAARIWLEVTDIGVERVREITEEDAMAEGVILGQFPNDIPSAAFCSLWISINGAESWNSNPWVWVVSFKVLSTSGKPETK